MTWATFSGSTPSPLHSLALHGPHFATIGALPPHLLRPAAHLTAGRSHGAISRAQARRDGAVRAASHIYDRIGRLRACHHPQRRCRRCARHRPFPAQRPCRPSDPPAPQRRGEPNHTHPAVAHALVGAGESTAAVSALASRRRSLSPPRPGRSCAAAASRRRRPAAALARLVRLRRPLRRLGRPGRLTARPWLPETAVGRPQGRRDSLYRNRL